jgi:hypothetical protein
MTPVEPQPRTFSREEAEALLPEIDRLLGEAQALAERLAAAEQSAQAEQWKLRSNGKVQPELTGEAPEATRRSLARQVSAILERRTVRVSLVARGRRRLRRPPASL